MPYKAISPQQAMMLSQRGANIQDLLAYFQIQNQRTPDQAYQEWIATLPGNLQDSEADRLASQEQGDYLRNIAYPQIDDAIASSTHGGLGGTTNTFAADREGRLRAQANKEAESIRTAKKNEELSRIVGERAKMDTPYYSDFEGSLGVFAPALYSGFGGSSGGWGSGGGGGGGGGGTWGPGGGSAPSALTGSFFNALTNPSQPMRFASSPEFEPVPQVFGQPTGLQTQAQQQASAASKFAKAGAGLYDLVTKMKQQGTGLNDIRQGTGSMISGILGAPRAIAGGIGDAIRRL